jgi:small subunit ribosomal protein S6
VNYYEMMVLFSSNLSDEEVRDQSLQVEELLKAQKANIHLVDRWGKRKLAYAIKKQRQGYYDWFYYEMDPLRVAEVDRKLKMSETILRFMILKMEKIQVEQLHKEVIRRAEVSRQQAEAAAAAAAAPPPEEPEVAEALQPGAAAEPEAVPTAEEQATVPEGEETPQPETPGTEPVPEG